MKTVARQQREKAVAKFIDGLGGTLIVSAKTGYKAGNVRKWRCVNALPRVAWPELMKAFPQVSLDALLELEARS